MSGRMPEKAVSAGAHALRRPGACLHDDDVCARSSRTQLRPGVRLRVLPGKRLRLSEWRVAVWNRWGRLGRHRSPSVPRSIQIAD